MWLSAFSPPTLTAMEQAQPTIVTAHAHMRQHATFPHFPCFSLLEGPRYNFLMSCPIDYSSCQHALLQRCFQPSESHCHSTCPMHHRHCLHIPRHEIPHFCCFWPLKWPRCHVWTPSPIDHTIVTANTPDWALSAPQLSLSQHRPNPPSSPPAHPPTCKIPHFRSVFWPPKWPRCDFLTPSLVDYTSMSAHTCDCVLSAPQLSLPWNKPNPPWSLPTHTPTCKIPHFPCFSPLEGPSYNHWLHNHVSTHSWIDAFSPLSLTATAHAQRTTITAYTCLQELTDDWHLLKMNRLKSKDAEDKLSKCLMINNVKENEPSKV